MSIDHFTFDPAGRVYTLHFGEEPTADELASTLRRVGGFSPFVATVDVKKVQDKPTVCFTLVPGRDPVTSLDTLRRVLRPRLLYTLRSLTVTSIRERCGLHTATHIKAFFHDGLGPVNAFGFTLRMLSHLTGPESMDCQLKRDWDELSRRTRQAHEANRAYQQGKTVIKFTSGKGQCPSCASRSTRQN